MKKRTARKSARLLIRSGSCNNTLNLLLRPASMTASAALKSQVKEVGQQVESDEVDGAQETPNKQPDSPG